ncbi:hypothetical protein B9G55_07505 [Saccharibacillus sp. O16]|nr:hypothetical protein B9G55_07505 [Saccharibacillus sp. O16]
MVIPKLWITWSKVERAENGCGSPRQDQRSEIGASEGEEGTDRVQEEEAVGKSMSGGENGKGRGRDRGERKRSESNRNEKVDREYADARKKQKRRISGRQKAESIEEKRSLLVRLSGTVKKEAATDDKKKRPVGFFGGWSG